MFDAIYSTLQETQYENVSSFVRNIFYSVLNNQTSKGKRILVETLKHQKFSRHLSVKELQYLLSLTKFLKKHILTLKNASRYRVWYDKIKEIKELNL
jgi:hypothetical protein